MGIVKQVPVIRILFPFTGGVLIAYPGEAHFSIPLLLLLCLLLLLIQVSLYVREKCKPGSGWGSWIYFPAMLLCFIAGMGSGAMSRAKDPSAPVYERLCLRGRIMGGISQEMDGLHFLMKVDAYCSQDSICPDAFTVMVTLQGSREILPGQGECCVLTGSLRPVKNSGNPGEVDFQKILSRKGRWYYMQVDSLEAVQTTFLPERGFFVHPQQLNARLSRHWEEAGDPGSLLRALCLGDRSSLEQGLRSSYAASGSAHVLAVSGLHVGMLWWVLRHLLLILFPFRQARIPRLLILLLLLWLYAALTGFAPPVNRSVSMLSLYSLATLAGIRTKGMNILFLSFFLLILLKPPELFNMGFQLSYAAVFSIIIIQPLLSGILGRRKGLFRKIWDLSALSLAAQLGTFPLVLYYFHQFPLYFLLSNLLSFPLLSLILLLFVLAFPFLLFGGGGFLSNLMLFLARILNGSMETIAAWPASVIGGIYPGLITVLLMQTLLLALLVTIYQKRRAGFYPVAVLLLLLLALSPVQRWKQLSDSYMVVQHLYGGTLLTFREGLKLDHFLWVEEEDRVVRADRLLESCWGDRRFEGSVIRPLSGIYNPGAVSSCLCLSEGLWLVGNEASKVAVITKRFSPAQWEQLRAIPPDVVVLSGEPRLEAGYMKGPGLPVVVDGSCRRWYAARLERGGVQFHNTAEEGAFMAVKKPSSLGSY